MSRVWNIIEKLVRVIIGSFLRIFKIELTEKQWDTFLQFVKFAFVGVSNFLISYIVYAVFLAIGCHWLIGSIVGFVVSVLNSFFWNDRYVFVQGEGEKRSKWYALCKTFMSYAFSGLILANMLLFVWNDLLHINAFWGPVINLFITTPINFVLNKLWAFRTEKEAE